MAIIDALGLLPKEGAHSGESEDITAYTDDKKSQMGKLGWIREAVIEWYIKIEYTRTEEELIWLRIRRSAGLERRRHTIPGCPEEYVPAFRHVPLPPNYVEKLEKRRDWAFKA